MGRITVITTIKSTLEIPEGLTLEMLIEQFRTNISKLEDEVELVQNHQEWAIEEIFQGKPVRGCCWSVHHDIVEG